MRPWGMMVVVRHDEEVTPVRRQPFPAWLRLTAAVLMVSVLGACQTFNSVGVPTSDMSALVYVESYPDGVTEVSTALLRGLRALELAGGDRLWLGFDGAPAETAMWTRDDLFGNVGYAAAMQTEVGDVLRIELRRSDEEDAPQSLVTLAGSTVDVSVSGLEENDIVLSWEPETSADQLMVRVHLVDCDGATNPNEVTLFRAFLARPVFLDLASGSHTLGELEGPEEAIRCRAQLLVGRRVADTIEPDPAFAGLDGRSGVVVMNEPLPFTYELVEESN